jgi:hypothetical protein
MSLVVATGAGQAATEQKEREAKGKVTITGCLVAGASESSGEFILTENGAGRKVMVSGHKDLGKHVNHKVKVTGKNDTQKADRMTVEKIEHIADTCVAR